MTINLIKTRKGEEFSWANSTYPKKLDSNQK